MRRSFYCFVDETGQDTEGRLFVVIAVVLAGSREAWTAALEQAERASGKRRIKWVKARRREKLRYLELVRDGGLPGGQLYSKVFVAAGKDYQALTSAAIAGAIGRYVRQQGIGDYQATVIIDGLPPRAEQQVARLLRGAGIRTRKIRGARDEGDAAIRLADTVAGLVRGAEEGDAELQAIRSGLAAARLLFDL